MKEQQTPKKKKKDNPIGLIIIIVIFILMLANFPISFVKYRAGSTEMWRIVTPVYTYILPSPSALQNAGSTPLPETEFYFFPNNFKSLEELHDMNP